MSPFRTGSKVRHNPRPPAVPAGDSVLSKVRDSALRLLTYRGRSEAELRRRLLRRFPPELVDDTIAKLREQGLVDDLAFARWYRQNREDHRPRSDRLLQQELLRLGVSGEVIQEALTGFDDHANAYAAGRKLARVLADRASSEEYFRRRVGAHLLRRGFGHSLVRETVTRLWAELTPDPLDGEQHSEHNEEEAEEGDPKELG